MKSEEWPYGGMFCKGSFEKFWRIRILVSLLITSLCILGWYNQQAQPQPIIEEVIPEPDPWNSYVTQAELAAYTDAMVMFAQIFAGIDKEYGVMLNRVAELETRVQELEDELR